MPRHAIRLVSLAAVVMSSLLSGCAAEGPAGSGDVAPRSEPAARMALRPEYKVFYDALADYGDWNLIEPYGYVFRPRVDPLTWRPYSYGYWAATDNYGWVWMSSDIFGWATDHYGRWFYDSYQGWVWIPGDQWGPAWVTWQMSDQYAGWAPLGPSGIDMYGSPIPGGPFLYAPLPQLVNTDVHSQALTREQLPAPARQAMAPIDNVIERDGARLMAGPPIAKVERATGFPIARGRLEDAVEFGTPQELLKRPTGGSLGAPREGEAGGSSSGAGSRIEAIRRAALEASRSAQELAAHPATTPVHLHVIRPFGVPGVKPGAGPAPGRRGAPGAGADSTGR